MMDAKVEETKAKKNETARDKFLRLAPARMEAALKKISLIGNLGGSGYESQPNEVKQMIAALTEAVEEVESKLGNKTIAKRGGFSFR
jgi:hypothetical protein